MAGTAEAEILPLSPVLRRAIRLARQNLRLTQYEAGAQAGTSERTWRALENDASYRPPARVLRAAVQTVRLSPDYLRAIGEDELAGLVAEDLMLTDEDPEVVIGRLRGSAWEKHVMLRAWEALRRYGRDRQDLFVAELLRAVNDRK
jgi:transcriptional regulator with XRE-family HTH domain